jgi:hypothetical protein
VGDAAVVHFFVKSQRRWSKSVRVKIRELLAPILLGLPLPGICLPFRLSRHCWWSRGGVRARLNKSVCDVLEPAQEVHDAPDEDEPHIQVSQETWTPEHKTQSNYQESQSASLKLRSNPHELSRA